MKKEASQFDRSVTQRETGCAFRDRRAYVAVVGEEQRRCGCRFEGPTRTYGDGFSLRRKRRCVGKARERENGYPRLRNETDSGHRSRRRVRGRRRDVLRTRAMRRTFDLARARVDVQYAGPRLG